jgi:hypothetical protein
LAFDRRTGIKEGVQHLAVPGRRRFISSAAGYDLVRQIDIPLALAFASAPKTHPAVCKRRPDAGAGVDPPQPQIAPLLEEMTKGDLR